MDIDTVREVKFLNILSHPNIINVFIANYNQQIHDIFIKKSFKKEKMTICMAMDFMLPLHLLIRNSNAEKLGL